MIRDEAALAPVLDALPAAREVALDTEFHGERHYHPRLMLVQLRLDDGPNLLVDPTVGLDLAPLARALESVPRIVVHGGQMDIQILHRLTGFRPNEVFDTQIAAGFVGDGFPMRLQELVRRHLGEVIPKTETLSDWSRRPLSEEQVRYAEDDVRVLGPLASALRARLEERGHTDLARSCAAEHFAVAVASTDDTAAWRTVPGAHLLEDRERAAMQRLAAWREACARAMDVPRYNVFSDSILLDLARRRPASIEAMRANRRLPSHVWKRDGAELLAVLAEARDAPAPPPARRYPRVWQECIQAAARVVEQKSGVATELLIDDDLLARLNSGGIPTGWRERALGEDFLAFLKGGAYIKLPAAIRRFPEI